MIFFSFAQTAMTETFNWMDDVDKFLKEITGTIAEGDVETIESQIAEVEVKTKSVTFFFPDQPYSGGAEVALALRTSLLLGPPRI